MLEFSLDARIRFTLVLCPPDLLYFTIPLLFLRLHLATIKKKKRSLVTFQWTVEFSCRFFVSNTVLIRLIFLAENGLSRMTRKHTQLWMKLSQHFFSFFSLYNQAIRSWNFFCRLNERILPSRKARWQFHFPFRLWAIISYRFHDIFSFIIHVVFRELFTYYYVVYRLLHERIFECLHSNSL